MPVVACVIPALDAAATLARVVAGIRGAVSGAVVVVVDDGSRDATAVVAAACADRAIRFASNRGKGAALRAGFVAALESRATAVLTIDADGQHDPACAPRLLAALDGADVVIGTRERRGSTMPVHRRASNAISAAAVSVCVGRRVADSQSGYRAMRADVLRRVAATGDRYEFETDFLIAAARSGLRIVSVPVPTIYGAPSHFRPVRDSARVVFTIARHLRTAARGAGTRSVGGAMPVAAK